MSKSDSPKNEEKSATLVLTKPSIYLRSRNTIATISLAEWRLCPSSRVKRMYGSRVDLCATYCNTIIMLLLESNSDIQPTITNHEGVLTAVCDMTDSLDSKNAYTVVIRGTSTTMRVFINSVSRETPKVVSSAIAEGENAVHIACLNTNPEMRINMHLLFQAVAKKLLSQLSVVDVVDIAVNSISLLEMLIDLKRSADNLASQLTATCYSTRLIVSSKCSITEHPRETQRLVTLLKTVYNWSLQFSEDRAIEILSSEKKWPTLLELLS